MADPITIYLTGDWVDPGPYFWVVPADWNSSDNTIECIGGGGDGYHNGGGGGAGGAYAKISNLSLVPGAAVAYNMRVRPSHGAQDTWFKDETTVLAKAGPSATGTSGAVAPAASESVGDVKYKGGDGGDGAGLDGSGYPRGSGGGGSAATDQGDGYNGGDADPAGYGGGGGGGTGANGNNASGDQGGNGGQGLDGTPGGSATDGALAEDGANGSGGGAGDRVGAFAGDGGNGGYGTDFKDNGEADGSYGFGGGGGGAGGDDSSFGQEPGGDGGNFGGGGAGNGYASPSAPSYFWSAGASGLIKITYTPTEAPDPQGENVPPALMKAENVKAFHLFEVDAGIVGTDAIEINPVVPYAYGIGSAPIDAISLEGTASVERRTFSYSDKGYNSPSSDPDGPKDSLARLNTPPSIQRVLNLSLSQAAAGFSWGGGAVARQNDDYDLEAGGFAGINYYSTDGAPARLYLGLKTYDPDRGIFTDPLVNDLMPLFVGVAQQWQVGRQTIQIPVRDLLYLLDKPLQRVVYSGAGGLGGDAAISGLPLPKARGGTSSYPIRNVKPVLVDSVNRIYQYNDGPGTVQVLYEGAYAGGITHQGDTTDLYSGSTNAGEYRTDNSKGLFQLGSDPVAEITCSVTGEFPRAGAITNPAEIARYLITEDLGISDDNIDLTNFTLAEAQYDYTAGVYFAPERNVNGVDAVAFVLGSIAAKIGTSRLGKLRPFVVQGYQFPSDAIYTSADIMDIRPQPTPSDLSPVVSRIRVRYGKNWTIQQSGYLGNATEAQKQFASGNGPVATWNSNNNAVKYPSAKDPPTIETALLIESEAQEIADALGAFWGLPRRAFQVDLPLYALERDIADNVRFDIDIGIRPYPFYSFVYGVSYTPGQPFCTLSGIA